MRKKECNKGLVLILGRWVWPVLTTNKRSLEVLTWHLMIHGGAILPPSPHSAPCCGEGPCQVDTRGVAMETQEIWKVEFKAQG